MTTAATATGQFHHQCAHLQSSVLYSFSFSDTRAISIRSGAGHARGTDGTVAATAVGHPARRYLPCTQSAALWELRQAPWNSLRPRPAAPYRARPRPAALGRHLAGRSRVTSASPTARSPPAAATATAGPAAIGGGGGRPRAQSTPPSTTSVRPASPCAFQHEPSQRARAKCRR
jgi:hypothetical protein